MPTPERELIELDLRGIIQKIRERYGIKEKVVAISYGSDVNDLFVRFGLEPLEEGEPRDDGLVIIHYSGGKPVAVEILNLDEFMNFTGLSM